MSDDYSINKDVVALNKIYDSLIVSYLDDSEKYARNDAMSKVISHTIEKAFSNAGQRIKFQHFGNTPWLAYFKLLLIIVCYEKK